MTAVLNIIAIVILEKGRKSEVRRDSNTSNSSTRRHVDIYIMVLLIAICEAEKSNNPAITNLTIFSFGNILYLKGCDIAMYLSIAITEIIKHVVRPLNINMNEIKSHIGCPPTHCNLLI
jgi:hypothetical protein